MRYEQETDEPDDVVAILCSDIHLSHKAPVSRSAEPDWYDTMLRYLKQLEALAKKYDVPIICAGDVFDKWNSPPELINFAIEFLPKMYAIPGQHDLPLHNIEHIEKSAYWTLVLADIITPLEEPTAIYSNGTYICVHPFPWGSEIVPKSYDPPYLHKIDLAVVHAYIWTKKSCYHGAPEKEAIGVYRKQLKGYDAAVFGDNHKGFLSSKDEPVILNCGGFIRRKSDEVDYRPSVGLLLREGMIERHYLNTDKDKFVELPTALRFLEDSEIDGRKIARFLKEIGGMSGKSIDFLKALKRYVYNNNVDSRTKKIILEAME